MGLRAPQIPQPQRTNLPEFEQQRKKVEQRIAADTQGQQDAMKRRFAAQGMLNSGAAIKQAANVANQAAQNREQALAGVDAAEMAEQRRMQEIQANRDFAAQESRLGREFQGSEAALARALQKEQFEKQFGLQERDFTRSGEQFEKQFGRQGEQFEKQFNLGRDQFAQQLAMDKTRFNAERGDQARNIAVSIAQMDPKTQDAYFRYLQNNNMPLPKPVAPQTQQNNRRGGANEYLWA